MIETSIFGGRILPTLQPYPTIHPASPPVAPQTAWRTGRDPHLCCDLLDPRRKTWVFDCPWFDCGFINSHGCYPLLATLTYLTFQLDAHMPLANKDLDMLETPLQNLWYPWRGLFLNQFCGHQSTRVPNTWREKCCRFEILWTLRRTPKPCLGVQFYVAIFIYVYNIYINNYIYITYMYIYHINIY